MRLLRLLSVAWICCLAGVACAEDARAPAASSAAPADDAAAQRRAYVAIVRREAEARGLPPEVAEAVAQIESGYNPSAVGGVGEIGLMQIRPETAETLGHTGGALALFDPEVNARYSVRYLAEAWKLAGGDLCRALMKYRAGHNSEWMSPLSAAYCQRAKAYLATLGSPLADGAAPSVVAINSMPGDKRWAAAATTRRGPYLGWRPGRHSEADNRRFWSTHEARIRTLTVQAERLRAARIKSFARRFARLEKSAAR